MKKQKINIYYHSDLDGVFSAILIAKTYVDNNIDCKFTFIPVNYDIKNWQEQPLESGYNIIVDFMYNPSCDVFYDHHISGWGEIEPKQVAGRFDDKAPSCCQVIFEDPNRLRFKEEGYVEEIVKGISICDYALYSSPEEPYDITKWYSALRMSLMEDGSPAYMDELIKLFLYNTPVWKRLLSNIIPDISIWRAAKVNHATTKGFEVFKKSYQYENRIVSFVVPPYEKFDRYFPFKAEPTALYTIYVRDNTWLKESPKCYMSLSKNPWCVKDPNVNIKEICELYQIGDNSKGGGHTDVGGIVTDTMEQALSIQRDILEKLEKSVVTFESATK